MMISSSSSSTSFSLRFSFLLSSSAAHSSPTFGMSALRQPTRSNCSPSLTRLSSLSFLPYLRSSCFRMSSFVCSFSTHAQTCTNTKRSCPDCETSYLNPTFDRSNDMSLIFSARVITVLMVLLILALSDAISPRPETSSVSSSPILSNATPVPSLARQSSRRPAD